MLLLAEDSPFWLQGLLIIGLVLIITSLLMGIRKRRRADANRLSPTEQIERNRQQSGMRGDLERLMVEIEQMAKRVGSQLDAKSIQLEKLLNEAELKIAQLQELRESLGQMSQLHMSQPEEADTAGPDIADPAAQKVYELADQGRTPVEIAQQLDEHLGKVELILALRKA